MKDKFNLEVDETNEKLPNIYWFSKLHKNLIKARFTIVTPKYLVKLFSKDVTAALKLIYKGIGNFNFKVQ